MPPMSLRVACREALGRYIWHSCPACSMHSCISLASCSALTQTIEANADAWRPQPPEGIRLTTESPDSTQPDQISTAIYNTADAADVVTTDHLPSREVTEVAKDIITWCMVCWGGQFVTPEQALTAWAASSASELSPLRVRCAVMLLSMSADTAGCALQIDIMTSCSIGVTVRVIYTHNTHAHCKALCQSCSATSTTSACVGPLRLKLLQTPPFSLVQVYWNCWNISCTDLTPTASQQINQYWKHQRRFEVKHHLCSSL